MQLKVVKLSCNCSCS